MFGLTVLCIKMHKLSPFPKGVYIRPHIFSAYGHLTIIKLKFYSFRFTLLFVFNLFYKFAVLTLSLNYGELINFKGYLKSERNAKETKSTYDVTVVDGKKGVSLSRSIDQSGIRTTANGAAQRGNHEVGANACVGRK
jgi:hypothetical protein